MALVYAAAGLLSLCGVIAYITYRICFHSPHKGQNDIYNIPQGEQYERRRERMVSMITQTAAIPCEIVAMTNRKGMVLKGRYYHQQDGAPVAICFHGYRGTSIRDFSGGCQYALELGHNVLMIDQRAHSLSEGHTIGFGVTERLDCLDWIDYVIERCGKDVEIALHGISMGAATVLLAAGMELPENVRCVVADSPYNHPRDIIRKVCKDMGFPPALVYPFIALGARLFGQLRLNDGNVVAAAANAKIPILIIHGEDDRLVPCHMSEIIQQANPGLIERQTFPNAGHGISYTEDKLRYQRIMREFTKKHIQL